VIGSNLITCGSDGVRSVPLDGTPETVIDPEACDGSSALWLDNGRLIYPKAGSLWRVPLDGSGPPELVLPAGQRLLAFSPDDQLVYSTDPSDRYAAGAGDGWLGNWRFMERGRAVSYSRDGKRLRWLEHAAKQGGIGDLYSAEPNQSPLHLARNVRVYEPLSDGRILAGANHAFRGVQNRVITIDEQARASYWVADQAADYVRIPGSNDLLIDVVTGPTAFDVVRVPIPPKPTTTTPAMPQ
jgi:hypothetical protein